MSEIKDLSVAELQRRLSDEEESLSNLRFQLTTSQLESPIKVRLVRRDIARIKTLLGQKLIPAGQKASQATTEVKNA